MTTQVQFRRGTTTQHNSFTGAVGEVTVDTDLDTLRVHDGAVAGGVRIAKFADIATQTIDISDSGSNTISLAPGSGDITFIGNDITTSATGNTMTFTLNSSISVDNISSQDSSAISINSPLNVNQIQSTDSTGVFFNDGITISGAIKSDASGTINIDDALDVEGAITSGAITSSGIVTGTGFTAGSAVLTEAELEKLDGITNGAGAANKALVLDGSANVASGLAALTASGVVTAAGFTIGSAVIDETDLEKLDGITNGTAAANKALVIDGSKDIGTLGAVTATTFVIGSADINETDLEKIDGITNGTVAANKAVVADANLDVGTFRNVNMSGNLDVGGDLQLDGNLTVSGTTQSVNTTTLEITDSLIELSKNNSGGSDLDAGILINRGSAGNNAAFYWNEGDDKFKAVLSTSVGTATSVTDSSQATIVASLEGTTVVGGTTTLNAATITNSTGAISFGNENLTTTGTIGGGVITGTGFTIGSAAMNETDLEKLDGITNGTVAAAKAVVPDADKDVGDFRNVTATTFIGALTGNADTATILATARTIGGVSFNGSANINLPGVNAAGNQNTSGTAAIGTAVTVTANNTANETCFITFVDGATGTQGIETDTGLNYNPSTNVLATTATAAQYSDVAEKYIGDAQYESGTVVIFGGDHEVTTTELTHDPRVAGVVSTAPAYLMNSHLEATYVIDLALTGRVPCKVKGVVAKGDLIVSSQTAGVGMKLQQESYNVGCVIGKALEDKDTADVGVIEVVVGRL